MIGRFKDRRGFTLVEIMIAVFILTVALIGVISTTIMIIKGNDFSRIMTTATTLAKDKIEEIKKTSYTSFSTGTTTTDYRNIDSSAGTSGAYFTRVLTVTADGIPSADLRTVTVEVRWSWYGINRSVTLRTLIGA